MKARVIRAFCIGGKRQEPGSVVDLADVLIRELIALGKCEAVAGEPPAPAPSPMTTESVPDLVQGKARKEKKDAG